jgi:hypothetical protein
MSTWEWAGHGPVETTPRFYDARPCPKCGQHDSALPRRFHHPDGIRARCRICPHVGEVRGTWVEALASFYGPLAGRSPKVGPPVGTRVRVCESDPVGCYPLRRVKAGDIVTLIDFETGCWTLRRDDGLEDQLARQPPLLPRRCGATPLWLRGAAPRQVPAGQPLAQSALCNVEFRPVGNAPNIPVAVSDSQKLNDVARRCARAAPGKPGGLGELGR